jgi:hypothetical protein
MVFEGTRYGFTFLLLSYLCYPALYFFAFSLPKRSEAAGLNRIGVGEEEGFKSSAYGTFLTPPRWEQVV